MHSLAPMNVNYIKAL